MKDLYQYLECLIIGQGREVGRRLQLYPWQRRFLRGAFGQPDDAALGQAQRGGKTTFVAGIACAALNGPLAEPMAEVLLVASSFDQGLICFRHIQHFLQPVMVEDPKWCRVQDSANRATIMDKTTGAVLRVLGSDPRRLHSAASKLKSGGELLRRKRARLSSML